MVFVLSHGFLGMSAENTHSLMKTGVGHKHCDPSSKEKNEEVLLLHVPLTHLVCYRLKPWGWCWTHPPPVRDKQTKVRASRTLTVRLSETDEPWLQPRIMKFKENAPQTLQGAGGGVEKRKKTTAHFSHSAIWFNVAKVWACLRWLDKGWDGKAHQVPDFPIWCEICGWLLSI